jgi:hypothetical protein
LWPNVPGPPSGPITSPMSRLDPTLTGLSLPPLNILRLSRSRENWIQIFLRTTACPCVSSALYYIIIYYLTRSPLGLSFERQTFLPQLHYRSTGIYKLGCRRTRRPVPEVAARMQSRPATSVAPSLFQSRKTTSTLIWFTFYQKNKM